MNPYEANVWNIAARLRAWLYGLARMYKRPLLALLIGSITTIVGVGAAQSANSAPTLAPNLFSAQLKR